MLDAEDLQVIAYWGIRAAMVFFGITGFAATCGIAWRLFEALRG